MGKAALLYVGAAIMMMTGLYGAITRTGVETDAVQADYEAQVVAREIAQSAFNMAMTKVRSDFANHRPDRRDVDYGDGDFSYRAIGTSTGPVFIEAVGDVLESRHRVSGKLELIRRSPIAAVTFDGPVSNITSRGANWNISGLDGDIPSATLSGVQVRSHGVRSVLKQADQIAQAEMPGAQVVGVSGSGDFVQNEGLVTFSDIVDWVDGLDSSLKTEFWGNQQWNGGEVFGTPDDPAIVVVNGDLTIAGNLEGYGVLVVKGALDVRQNGTPVWEGLFIVESGAGTQHQMLGNTQIYGALGIVATTEEGETGGQQDAGILGGFFDVSVFNGAGDEIYQEHQYDDKYFVTEVDLLRAGCRRGGMCWEELVGKSGENKVTVSVISGDDGKVKMTGGLFDVPIDPALITSLRVTDFDLCSLPPADPGDVATDPTRALTVQVTGESGTVLYKASVYAHLINSACGYEQRVGQYFVPVEPIDFLIGGSTMIRMSSMALERLYTTFPLLATADPEFILSDVRESAEDIYTTLFEAFNVDDSSIDMREFYY